MSSDAEEAQKERGTSIKGRKNKINDSEDCKSTHQHKRAYLALCTPPQRSRIRLISKGPLALCLHQKTRTPNRNYRAHQAIV